MRYLLDTNTVSALMRGEEKVAASLPFEHQLAFPEYAVFLANDSDRPVKAQFFVYLRH